MISRFSAHKSHKILKGFPLLIVLLFLLSACTTVNEYPVSADKHYREFADVKVSLRYLDRDELIALHGEKTNPFVDFPGSIINRDNIMVFELKIESTETSVMIKQKRIIFNYEAVTENPISEYHLKEAWRKYNANSRERDIRNKVIGTHVRQGMLEAGPQSPLVTYIVFLDKFPSYGEASLSLPIVTADLKDQGIIEFPFSFDLAYIDPEKTEPGDLSPPSSDEDAEEEKKSIFE